MALPEDIVIQRYEGILRSTPSEAQIAAYADNDTIEELDNELLAAATVTVDPVVRLYQAVFGRVPDSAGLDFWVAAYNGGQGMTLVELSSAFGDSGEFETQYGGLTNSQIVGRLYANVLGRPGDAAGIAFWTEVLNNGGSIAEVIVGFSQSPEFIETTSPMVENFLVGAADGEDVYTGSLFDFVSPGDYQLTVGTDNLVGTVNDDVFDAPLAVSGGFTVNTLASDDTINGGGGHDKLFAEVAVLTGGDLSVNVTAVEEHWYTARNNVLGVGSVAIDFQDGARQTTGVEQIWNLDSETDLAIYDVSELVIDGAPITVGFSEQEFGNEYGVFFQSTAVAGAEDVINVRLADLENAGGLTIEGNTSGGVETWNVESIRAINPQTGAVALADDSFENFIDYLDGEDFTTLNVTGDQHLNIGQYTEEVRVLDGSIEVNADYDVSVPDTVRTVNASEFTGDLKIGMWGDDGDVAGDSVTTFTGGSGDDRLAVFGWSKNDTADGGEGDDTLIATQGSAAFVATAGAFTGFETLELTTGDGSITANLANISSDVERVVLNQYDGNNYDFTVNNLSKAIATGEGVIVTSADGGWINDVSINVAGVNAPGAVHDSLNVTVATNSDWDSLDLDSLNAKGIEILNLTSTGGNASAVNEIDVLDMAATGGVSELNISGDTDLVLGEDDGVSAGIINASALEADLTLYVENDGQGIVGQAFTDLNDSLGDRFSSNAGDAILVTGGQGDNDIFLDNVRANSPFIITAGEGGNDEIFSFRGDSLVANNSINVNQDLIILDGTTSLADLINTATISVGYDGDGAATNWDLVIDFGDDRGSITIDSFVDISANNGSFYSLALEGLFTTAPGFGASFIGDANDGLVELTDAQVTTLFNGTVGGLGGIGDSFYWA